MCRVEVKREAQFTSTPPPIIWDFYATQPCASAVKVNIQWGVPTDMRAHTYTSLQYSKRSGVLRSSTGGGESTLSYKTHTTAAAPAVPIGVSAMQASPAFPHQVCAPSPTSGKGVKNRVFAHFIQERRCKGRNPDSETGFGLFKEFAVYPRVMGSTS